MVIRVRSIEIDARRGTISHAAKTMNVPWGKRRWRLLISLLLGGGVTKGELLDFMYFDAPDGGPLYGEAQIATVMCKTAKDIARLDLKIIATRDSEPRSRYEIVPAYMERGTR